MLSPKGSIPRPRACDRRGFTLVELVMVIVVLGLISGAAATSLSGLDRARSNITAERLRRCVVLAQDWALASGEDTWVDIDLSNHRIEGFMGSPAQPLVDPLTRAGLVLSLTDEGVAIQSLTPTTAAELHFDDQGRPRDAAGSLLTADVQLELVGGATLRVTRNTGLIYVE